MDLKLQQALREAGAKQRVQNPLHSALAASPSNLGLGEGGERSFLISSQEAGHQAMLSITESP